MTDFPKITVAIPLFKSARFINNIIENIDNIHSLDVEFLISDRHCHDDTIDRLANHYASDHRVRCIKNYDQLDWVGHINVLLKEARGKYWQFLPHDDISPRGSLGDLIDALDVNPDAILAYGPTKRVDIDGQPLKRKLHPNPNHPEEAKHDWKMDYVLSMFWKGYFDGAFKGLIRRNIVIVDKCLFIRSTRDQILPERCWLFALGLLGRFHFVPEATYIKRFYKGSVHTNWNIQGCNYVSAARTMSGYLHDLIDCKSAYRYGLRDLWLNAIRLAQWRDTKLGKWPPYFAAPGSQSITIRKLQIPLSIQ